MTTALPLTALFLQLLREELLPLSHGRSDTGRQLFEKVSITQFTAFLVRKSKFNLRKWHVGKW